MKVIRDHGADTDAAPGVTRPEAAPSGRDFREGILRSSWSQTVRWLAILGLAIGNWAISSKPGTFAGWLPVVIISLILLLPDIRSVTFGGVAVELQRTKDELAELQKTVHVLQQQHVTTNVQAVDLPGLILAIRELVLQRAAESVAASEGPGASATDQEPPAADEFLD